MFKIRYLITVASLFTSSSLAPKDASPISWENSAKAGSAKRGTWPINSWHTSGSGVYKGLEGCRMYWVEWKTLKNYFFSSISLLLAPKTEKPKLINWPI